MIESGIAVQFLDKQVFVVRTDDGRDICSEGVITKVSPTALLLEFRGRTQAISLDSILNIREATP